MAQKTSSRISEKGPKYPRKFSRQLFARMKRESLTQGTQVWR